MTEERIRELAQQALFGHQTGSNFTLMGECEYVVDSAVRDMPEMTREARHRLWLRVWELTDDPDIRKAVAEQVAEYKATQEKFSAQLVSKETGETDDEVIATYSDGTQIRIYPGGIQILPPLDTEIWEREEQATWKHLYGSAPGYALERLATLADNA